MGEGVGAGVGAGGAGVGAGVTVALELHNKNARLIQAQSTIITRAPHNTLFLQQSLLVRLMQSV